jgi:hypothetical protein
LKEGRNSFECKSYCTFGIYLDGDGGGLLEVSEVADNKWDSIEHRKDRFDGIGENYPAKNEANNDDVALDAHWGAEIVLRYWSEIHNREL